MRPGAAPDPVVRFETPPAYRRKWTLPLLVVLGYSRLLWIQFYPRQTLTVLMRGLEEVFSAFGGKVLKTWSLRASRRTGDSGSAPAVRIVPARRVKSNVRLDTYARASFTAESSLTARTGPTGPLMDPAHAQRTPASHHG
jgi:hypothetical protein